MTLVRFQDQLPNIFERFFGNEMEEWGRRNFAGPDSTLPAVNIKETPEAFEVEVAAPGFDKSDFKIELNDGVLTISSEKEMTDEVKEGEMVTRREFNYQSFTRSFTLPDIIDEDKISAKYKDGILMVTIPKKDEAKPKPVKQIKVK